MQETRFVGWPTCWKIACAVCVLSAMAASSAHTQTFTSLFSFDGTDGQTPYAALVQATNGNLYGTTSGGGANRGGGTIFRITPSGTLTTLYSFCSQSGCTDGEFPDAALIEATDGNFYGTTSVGGANNACDLSYGCGTVFKITPGGTLTTLHSFDGTEGYGPVAGLVQDTNGNFYGTTLYGGADSWGTVFKITPSGTLTTLHSFAGYPTDGASPDAALVQASDGSLYGTTDEGGANIPPYGEGTLFKISTSGTLTTLYSFCLQSTGHGCLDGSQPNAGLVQDTNGNFYGTTQLGGVNASDNGTVFSLSVGLGPFVGLLPAAAAVGHQIGILGTNLTGATSVTFNGTAAVFKVSSASLITATVPSGATSGTVKVVTPRGTLTSNVPFRVKP